MGNKGFGVKKESKVTLPLRPVCISPCFAEGGQHPSACLYPLRLVGFSRDVLPPPDRDQAM